MADDTIQKLTDALLEKDKGTVLPIDLNTCYEYGMRGLCGNECPDFGSKRECGEEVVMERLTKRTAEGIAYLANVKQDEQVIEGSRNTLQCLYDSWQKLAEYEDKIEVGDLIKVVRCKDCKWLVTSEKTNRLFCGWHSDGDMQLQIFENDYCNEGERR